MLLFWIACARKYRACSVSVAAGAEPVGLRSAYAVYIVCRYRASGRPPPRGWIITTRPSFTNLCKTTPPCSRMTPTRRPSKPSPLPPLAAGIMAGQAGNRPRHRRRRPCTDTWGARVFSPRACGSRCHPCQQWDCLGRHNAASSHFCGLRLLSIYLSSTLVSVSGGPIELPYILWRVVVICAPHTFHQGIALELRALVKKHLDL